MLAIISLLIIVTLAVLITRIASTTLINWIIERISQLSGSVSIHRRWIYDQGIGEHRQSSDKA